jgi:hypothetical protein
MSQAYLNSFFGIGRLGSGIILRASVLHFVADVSDACS